MEGEPQANDRASPTVLTPLVRRTSLVSQVHRTSAIYPTHTIFHPEFLKPSLPGPREKASLRPPLTTMPGSLFPRSPSMFPDFAPALQTPRIQRVTYGAPSPSLEQPDPIGAEVQQTLEDCYAEADISSGALSQQLRCELLLTPTRRGRSIPT